jgi:hypothetical protein
MKCADMSATGITVGSLGGATLVVRQIMFKEDYTRSGLFISFLGGCALAGGIAMYNASSNPKNCKA